MTLPSQPSTDLLDRYLANDCSEVERAVVDTWVASAPEHALWMGRMRRVATSPLGAVPRPNADELWRRTLAAIDAQPGGDVPLELVDTGLEDRGIMLPRMGRPAVAPWYRRWSSHAAWVASAAVVVLAAVWFGIGRMTDAPTTAYIAYTTTVGQVANVTLTDGTRVTLGPGTTLGVSRTFGRVRDVTLTGEALFDVTAAQRTPFLVHTGNVTTRVLGTRFDVKRYASDTATQVVVVSGKVASGSPRQSSVTLVAGAMGHITDSTATVVPVSDMTTVTGWTVGRLRFHERPASEVLAQLSRWYGVEFQLADSTLGREVITTDINFKQTADVIGAIEWLLNVKASSGGAHSGTPVIVLHRRAEPLSDAPSHQLRRTPIGITHTEVGR